MQDLKSKVGFITGGSKGIGYGIAESMLEQGMRVAITGRDNRSLEEAKKTLSTKGDVLAIQSDVRDMSSMEKAFGTAIDKWSGIDVIVANAGVGHFASIEDLTSEQWNDTIDINLTGVFNTIKAGLDHLKASKGYFITISSLAGTNFFAGGAAYNASKFGLTGFTQAAMLDLRKYGIKTTTIMPGSVATYFNEHTPGPADSWKIQIKDLGQIVVDLLKIHPRTLPSKIEVRPTTPPGK